MRRTNFILTSLLAASAALADVVPLPRAEWPSTVAAAVPHIVAALHSAQKSIVRGTSKENLFMLQGEWGEDVERLLGLNSGNVALVVAACGKPCPVDQATLLLMEAAWDALEK